ncbi:ComEC/Rec2 family competence protein [Clostridium polynesiense]|uniref:ComEC/Rec2 family competence protein n=1 Tax=Clostridium polynesiense TaxID=1325933 RepID=UPI000694EB03|nr:MBL fold metallo-hydrolase [Clostridium polynesiense]
MRNNKIIKIYFTLSVLTLFVFFQASVNVCAGEVPAEVQFIHVGQGDCILIKGKRNYLIDTGNLSNSHKVINHLRQQGVNELEKLIITHYHEDHYGGIKYILQYIKVNKVILPMSDNIHKEEIVQEIKKVNGQYDIIKNNIELIDDNISLYFIAPSKEDRVLENNNSTIILGIIDGISYLLMADAENNLEREIMDKYHIKNINILKVAHHGLLTGSSRNFLNKVKADFAVITCNGEESPSYNVLQRIKLSGSSILRTDKLGTIKIIRDKNNQGHDVIKIYNLKE